MMENNKTNKSNDIHGPETISPSRNEQGDSKNKGSRLESPIVLS
jgi:hypothetical protein